MAFSGSSSERNTFLKTALVPVYEPGQLVRSGVKDIDALVESLVAARSAATGTRVMSSCVPVRERILFRYVVVSGRRVSCRRRAKSAIECSVFLDREDLVSRAPSISKCPKPPIWSRRDVAVLRVDAARGTVRMVPVPVRERYVLRFAGRRHGPPRRSSSSIFTEETSPAVAVIAVVVSERGYTRFRNESASFLTHLRAQSIVKTLMEFLEWKRSPAKNHGVHPGPS